MVIFMALKDTVLWVRLVAGMCLLLGMLMVLGCSDDDNPIDGNGTNGTNQVVNNLVFNRQDSTTIPMATDMAICCGVWETGYIDENTLKVMYYDTTMQVSGWRLFILIDSARTGAGYLFPTDVSGESAVSMFVYDVVNLNETNSDVSESSGGITINSFSCGPPVRLDVTINATLGSEFFQGPSIDVAGSFSCTIYDNPAPFGCDFSF